MLPSEATAGTVPVEGASSRRRRSGLHVQVAAPCEAGGLELWGTATDQGADSVEAGTLSDWE
ncbi:MAG: hypothetical protein ACTSPE_09265 [Candidatus Thorarchaeota archaeon]